MGKVMILSFSNSEEHIMSRIIYFLEKEKSEEMVEISTRQEILLKDLCIQSSEKYLGIMKRYN